MDDASNATQALYLRLRIQERGGAALLLGQWAGQEVDLSSPAWEWGEMELGATVERALPDPGAVSSCDTEAELTCRATGGPACLHGNADRGLWEAKDHGRHTLAPPNIINAGQTVGALLVPLGPRELWGL